MKSKLRKEFFLFVFSLCLLGISQAWGQKSTVKNDTTSSGFGINIEKNQPFQLKWADHLIWEDPKIGEKTAVLSGKVHILLEKDRLTIMADTVWYYSISSTYKAAGHVKITKIDENNRKIIAISQKANYNQNKNQIILEGNAKINRAKDEMTGDVLVITSTEQGTILEGDNVQAILYPEQQQSQM